MAFLGIPHLKKFPLPLVNFRLSPTSNGYLSDSRGCGLALRATIEGERHSFRTLDYAGLLQGGTAYLARQLARRNGGAADVVPDRTEIPKKSPALFDWRPNLECRPTLITPVFTDHDQVYHWLKSYKAFNRKSFVLIINVDAHRDRGYTGRPEPVNYTNWAQVVEDERLGRVIHFPSYLDDRSGLIRGANWNTPVFRIATAEIIKKMKEEHEERLEVWVTIDYDFFSGITVFLRGCELSFAPAYHLENDGVQRELAALTGFLAELDLPVSQVIPCSSPEYLGAPDYQKEGYIAEVTRLVQQAF